MTRELKGLPEPVAVSEVVWSAAVDTSVLPLPEVVETAPVFAFAGRTAELDAARVGLEGGQRRRSSPRPDLGRTWHRQDAAGHRGRPRRPCRGRDHPLGPLRRRAGRPVRAVRRGPASLHQRGLRPTPSARAGSAGGGAHPVAPRAQRAGAGPGRAAAGRARGRTSPLVRVGGRPARRQLGQRPARAGPRRSPLGRQAVAAAAPSHPAIGHRRSGCSSWRPTATPTSIAAIRSPTSSATCAGRAASTRLDLMGLDGEEVEQLMESAAGHDLDGPALELAKAVHSRDRGQPVLRRPDAAAPGRVRG